MEDIKDMLNGVGRVVMYYVHKNKVGNPKYREVQGMFEGKMTHGMSDHFGRVVFGSFSTMYIGQFDMGNGCGKGILYEEENNKILEGVFKGEYSLNKKVEIKDFM